MYPHGTRIDVTGALVAIDDHFLEGELDLEIELESRAGVGTPQLTFRIAGRTVEVGISAPQALSLADALAFYGNASQRIAKTIDLARLKV